MPKPPAWLRAVRPKQWLKNLLTFAAPVAGGQLFEPSVLRHSFQAFVAFCLVSSAVYLVNDLRDAEADRQHPTKRFRPIAAGELSPKAAVPMAVGCALAALLVAWPGGGWQAAWPAWLAVGWPPDWLLLATIATYLVLQLAYSAFLKHQPVIDLAMVASGFLLRAVAGGVASDIALSQWFLLVASFGSLFMVSGKRYSELKTLGDEARTRPSLAQYSLGYLALVTTASVAVLIVCYCLWALDSSHGQLWGVNWAAVSTAPFTLAVLRYAKVVDAGQAGEPEEVVLTDHMLQALAVLWAIPLAVAVFA
ncbi:MAG: decaprenyl-phosphate phosphoribosyltransferase [Propionibacteriaceae bacterium]|jgi:decaprenyl-phosphate phosphoribosyltransferase|nr:decaprenyl-phosphate phosphoribosyltransferase [Propionibacteriaceae bacterium]